MAILIIICVLIAIGLLIYTGVKDSKEITADVTTAESTVKNDISAVKTDATKVTDTVNTATSQISTDAKTLASDVKKI